MWILQQAGGKPKVAEVGPFVYKEIRKKVGITREADTIIYGRLVRP
jgi:CD36 family